MRAALFLALTIAASSCGGIAAIERTSAGSDGGSTQSTPTAPGDTTTAAAIATAPTTGTYTSTSTDTFLVASTPTGTGATVETSSASCVISASNYDQTCTADADCAQITPGDYCGGGPCLCAMAAISAAALAQFNADVSETPVGSGAAHNELCVCPEEIPGDVCCRNGACTMSCASPSDTLPACAMAQGICGFPAGLCMLPGPADSCAYADEICCRYVFTGVR